MNENDLHDILEKISEKDQARSGMFEFGKNLGSFRKALLEDGFAESEALVLSALFMISTLNNSK
ncbi:hypothetical protein [Enterococcus gilvus]|uniref:Uncharacterized protein n=1 Tax=Enterococcus gilvus ATCC BAA-350 TaxID=1158614 RepID=R2XRG9_9ENTE|nr:hypothetical protein [Enterococcus gilvus]EOI57469.1 hypothetical protein UKC_01686 [Enterococcus gilvus ATCC BAA-350]EOW82957.1 hypothetical protein I592_02281 [Enterococcus gilvus ATCC BAA-350]OJG40879.1 hypothetical protein RV02_GL001733 [Enterococcus gilvus]